ncbi:MAG: SDR family oxidoreductase [Bacteroidota bacterium]
MNLDFSGKHIAITAGASGIGYAIAKSFERYGAKVFICDIDEKKVSDVNAKHAHILGSVVDVADAKQVARFFDFIRTHSPKLDVLVNNAGIAGPTALTEEIKPEEWDQTIAVNLNGMFYSAREAIPMIKTDKGGSIVNIASSAAYFGYPYRSPYAASKWAILGFTKTMAMELGPLNINVNAICPGSVKGPRIDAVIGQEALQRNISFEEVKTGYERQVSMRSFVDAEDVAHTILFLSSPYGRMISGQTLGVDGHTETLTNY